MSSSARPAFLSDWLSVWEAAYNYVTTNTNIDRKNTGSIGNDMLPQHKSTPFSDALAAISKTIDLAGKPSQLYGVENKYQLHLKQVVEVFQQVDTPRIPQLAAPVSVPSTAYTKMKMSNDPLIQRIGCIVLVTFYFLLRVGDHKTSVCD